MKTFIALLIVAGLASTQALCPNSCSGHGTCIADPKDSCQCYTRLETNHEYGKAVTVAAWTGADCSLRTCPSGYAWAAAPQDDQDHKQKLECSGKGQCDRKSGECKYIYMYIHFSTNIHTHTYTHTHTHTFRFHIKY